MSEGAGITPGTRPGSDEPRRWRAQFPYRWDLDDLVSRRSLLELTVYTSGALFFSTVALAALSLFWRSTRTEPRAVARVGELAEGEARYFYYPGAGDEAMLLHLPGGQFVAYSQKCTHLACAVYYQPDRERLYCPCHEGVFSPLTGDPEAGPPQRRLPRIVLQRDGDTLYAVGMEP